MMKRTWISCLLTISLLMGGDAFAGETRIWELAGFTELDKGDQTGTAVSSVGEVSLGKQTQPMEIKDVGVIWTAARLKNGDVILGTGHDGKLYRSRGNKVEHVANTGQLIVTAILENAKGELLAATLPDPIIWKIPSLKGATPGKPVVAEKWATLPKETKHVWSLALGKDNRTVYAGCGPEGQIFAIGTDGKPDLYLDTEDEHVMTLATDKEGKLLAGTSPSALLLQVSGPGRSRALADFDATEVKAVAVNSSGILEVAVNSFSSPPTIPTKIISKTSTTTSTPTTTKKSQPKTGDGFLYRVDQTGRWELVWQMKKSHVVSMAVDKGGITYLGLGTEGKVISVDKERAVRTELDLQERQVMALVTDKSLLLAATGDAAALYKVKNARAAEAVYLSPPLDAGRVSSFGRITWFSRGNLLCETRTGNTEIPDKSWSDWSKGVKKDGQILSDDARYLQLRFSFKTDPKAVLISAQVAFKPQNLRGVIEEFKVGSPFANSTTTKKNLSVRTIDAHTGAKEDPELNLTWDVDNPDKDTLRYRLYYRAMGQTLWRPILKEDEVLTKDRYTWETGSVPEGVYQLKLEADDSPKNDPKTVLSDQFLSVPVRVDNHPPTVQQLSYQNQTITGQATDSFSPIAIIQVAVDNGPWATVAPNDGLYDESTETFAYPLPKSVTSGPHAIAVRTYDQSGNMGISELHIER